MKTKNLLIIAGLLFLPLFAGAEQLTIDDPVKTLLDAEKNIRIQHETQLSLTLEKSCPDLTVEQRKKVAESISADKLSNVLVYKCYPKAIFKKEKKEVGVINDSDGTKSYGTKGFTPLAYRSFSNKVFAISISKKALSGKEDACPDPYTCYSFANIFVYNKYTGKREEIISVPFTMYNWIFTTLTYVNNERVSFPVEISNDYYLTVDKYGWGSTYGDSNPNMGYHTVEKFKVYK